MATSNDRLWIAEPAALCRSDSEKVWREGAEGQERSSLQRVLRVRRVKEQR
jgi:hypothetical protein